MSPGMRPTSIPSGILINQPAVWPQHEWTENWGAVPLRGGGAGTPPNTMWPGPRPTCMPSFMLIHPSNCLATICQSYRRTDRTDRQWTDSIGQTVLQMVDQKLKPGLVVFYNIQPGNRVGLFWFRRFINLSLTYLLDTYLQHRTHTGHSCLL